MLNMLPNELFVEQPFQTTVCKNVFLEGIGLHSGRFVRMVIRPAPANSGIKFRRVDINGQLSTVIAHANFAEQARLCTRIVNREGITLETIEHLMATFAGVGLDNAVIETDASEAPILDGSSQPILDAINNAGLETLPAKRKLMLVTKPVEVQMELEAKRTALLLDVKPGSYQVRRLDSSAQHVRGNVVSYLADKMGAVERSRVDLRANIRDLESLLSSLPKTQRDILAMERKLGVNEKLALYLLERKAANIIARASITPEASLIERARYAGKVGPNKRRTILTYTATGLLLALILAVVRTMFFERIESTSELRECVEAPVVAGIPFFKELEADPIACRHDSRSAVTESFRALRTNLQYLLAKEGANVILVSSLHPQEGKSFVSANLASILAKAEKKVALVDFDMHKPRIHTLMGLSNERGASNILVGKATLMDSMKPGAYASMDVLTAGPVPPNASDLILSERMGEAIAQLKANYDFVILDTPPILPISDALVLMEHVDSALVVTNVNKSSRRGVQHLEQILKQNGLRHASFVLNGLRAKRWAYYYNRYASKYGYAIQSSEYGYGGSEQYKNDDSTS